MRQVTRLLLKQGFKLDPTDATPGILSEINLDKRNVVSITFNSKTREYDIVLQNGCSGSTPYENVAWCNWVEIADKK